jgi:hypothetical protein
VATSSKVKFNLETLTEKAIEAIEAKVALAKIDFDAFEDPSVADDRLAAWRAAQKERVEDLLKQINDGTVSDRDLMVWKVQPAPGGDTTSERTRALNTLRALQSQRDQIKAKAESLVADEDGSIALTKTQLEEFFGL